MELLVEVFRILFILLDQVPCDCFCNQCKATAIREAGEKWYDRCKELGGVYEVIGWEAF